ncbi:plasmid pRiA4b ORF-3 family protein [Nitrosomonas aestuarii]|nr:plasmid pRiA4b ORF-3 family protein [Nitrosomonas aestuarii]
MNTRSLRSIYQLKVTLKNFRPPIWRRFLLSSTTNLGEMHHVLQIVMGWANAHLHEFVKENERYGEPEIEFPLDIHDETEFRLDQILKQEKEKLIYNYDFGDDWQHEILLEKVLPFKHDAVLPICIKGKRACPPEDVGGAVGYAMFLEAVSDSLHPEYAAMREWANGNFDSAFFDLDAVNNLLHEYCGRKR